MKAERGPLVRSRPTSGRTTVASRRIGRRTRTSSDCGPEVRAPRSVILSREACAERSRTDGEGSQAAQSQILRSIQDDGGLPKHSQRQLHLARIADAALHGAVEVE